MTLSELETLSRIVCLWMATSACAAIFCNQTSEWLRRRALPASETLRVAHFPRSWTAHEHNTLADSLSRMTGKPWLCVPYDEATAKFELVTAGGAMPADPRSTTHRAREIAHRERKPTPRQTTREVTSMKKG